MKLRHTLVALPLACAACTFTGLGSYDVLVCARPTGTSATVQQVGQLSSDNDLGFASASGKNVIAAFTAGVTGGTCIQGVGANGYLDANCAFLASELTLVPRQPMILSLGAGRAAALIATSAPCTQGKVLYRFDAPGVAVGSDAMCAPSGAALPSIAALPDGATAIVAWYETAFATRSDPIGACVAAKPATLYAAAVTGAASEKPILGTPVRLADNGISVRPAAIATVPGQTQVVLAAPLGSDVGLWTLDATVVPGAPISIPGLAGARAVSVAIAADGSGRLAVVAEIGCAPQGIAVAVGKLGEGFVVTQTAPVGSDAAVQPSVAWVDSVGRWVVSWISTHGGAHAVARWFDADGLPLGDEIVTDVRASGAWVTSDADVFAFVPSAKGFVDTSLGCTP